MVGVVRRIIAATLLQPVFYGVRLLSATATRRVDSHVELVGVTLEGWGVTSS